MRSYIVRVYRRNPDNNDEMAGIIENVGTQCRESFLNFYELQESLKKVIRSEDAGSSEARQIDICGYKEIQISAVQARMENNALL